MRPTLLALSPPLEISSKLANDEDFIGVLLVYFFFLLYILF